MVFGKGKAAMILPPGKISAGAKMKTLMIQQYPHFRGGLKSLYVRANGTVRFRQDCFPCHAVNVLECMP